MRLAIILGVVFLACAGVAAIVAPRGANQGFADAASVLAFISLAAVAIERSIEGMYTVLSGRLGQWWPFNLVKAEFDSFETQTDALLGPILDSTLTGLNQAKAAFADTSADAKAIQKTIDDVTAQSLRLRAQFDDARLKLVPGSDRLERVGEINAEITGALQLAQKAAQGATTNAQAALQVASDAAERSALIIASIQDNPARRLASLAIGSSLGMLIAAAAGLNLFAATLVGDSTSPTALPSLVAGTFGIVLTGIVMGFGSAPTHEVVKSLQAYRDSRNGGNLVMSGGAGATGVVGGVVTEGAMDGGRTRGVTVTRTMDPGVRMHRVRRTS